MKKLALLGSTGSIGTQTLEVAECLERSEEPVKIEVLAAARRIDILEGQARRWRPKAVAVFEEAAARDLRGRVRDLDLTVLSGMEGLCEAAAWPGADLVLNAAVGMVGLRPTLAALAAGKPVALANKETLVAGGHLVMEEARRRGLPILPVDSEHSAIFQCLQGRPPAQENVVKKLILTASGGAFFGKTREELETVTPAQALKHPNWSMGAKVTVDSATMMNKGLEVMEARWLFDIPVERIDVVVHRESIVHSLVEYADHSVIAQLGLADMRIPIQYAMTYPGRYPSPAGELSLPALGSLSFYEPDRETFPSLSVCIRALQRGGLAPAAANGANEQAVALFLAGEIGFLDIPRLVEEAMLAQPLGGDVGLEAVLQADESARRFVLEQVRS